MPTLPIWSLYPPISLLVQEKIFLKQWEDLGLEGVCQMFVQQTQIFGHKRFCHKTGRSPSLHPRKCSNNRGINILSSAEKVFTTIYEANTRKQLQLVSARSENASTESSVFPKFFKDSLEMDLERFWLHICWFFCCFQPGSLRFLLRCDVDPWFCKKVVSGIKALFRRLLNMDNTMLYVML